MEIYVFTVRNLETNELIYAEGTESGSEYCSSFAIDGKWLTDEEKARNGWYRNYKGLYGYDEEVRHLNNYSYQFIRFAVEKLEYH